MPVREMLARMSSSEIAEWEQYFRIVAWEAQNEQSSSGLYNPDAPPIESLIQP